MKKVDGGAQRTVSKTSRSNVTSQAAPSSSNAGTIPVPKSARGLAHSRTLPRNLGRKNIRQVLECASPLALCASESRQNA